MTPLNRKIYVLNIYYIYIMRKVKFEETTKLSVDGIAGFMERKVTSFGTGAKVDCPKEYLGKRVYLVVLKDDG